MSGETTMHGVPRKTIELDRSLGWPVGLGFSVASEIGIKVKEIAADGAAAKEGQLKVGDIIVEVDGVKLDESVSHNKAVGMLRGTAEKVKLVVARRAKEVADEKELEDKRVEDIKNKEWWEVERVELPRCKDDIRLALYKQGLNNWVVVSHINEDSEVYKQGRVKVGDVVLQINDDYWLQNWSAPEILSKIRNGIAVHLLVGRQFGKFGDNSKAKKVPYSALASRHHLKCYLHQHFSKETDLTYERLLPKDGLRESPHCPSCTCPPPSTIEDPSNDIIIRLSNGNHKEIKAEIGNQTQKLEQQKEEVVKTQSVIDRLKMMLESRTTDMAKEEFECPVCFCVMLPPAEIWQCGSGHVLCGNCSKNPNIKSCPTCRNPISGRNVAMEKIAKALF